MFTYTVYIIASLILTFFAILTVAYNNNKGICSELPQVAFINDCGDTVVVETDLAKLFEI